MKTSLVLKGLQGTGKGMIVQILGKIVGDQHFFQPTSQEDMFGSFNYMLDNRLLCFADEMFWGGDKKKAGQLKKLLTEDTRSSNVKYGPLRRLSNMINWIFASNEDWVIPAGIRARRFTVLDVDNTLHNMSRDDVTNLATFCPYSFARFLYNRNVEDWDCNSHINTKGLTNQKILSMCGVHKWWCDKLQDLECDWFTQGQVVKKYVYLDFTNTASGFKPTEKAFWMDMNKIQKWAPKLVRMKDGLGSKSKPTRVVIFPSRSECILNFNKLYDCQMVTEDDEVDLDDENKEEEWNGLPPL